MAAGPTQNAALPGCSGLKALRARFASSLCLPLPVMPLGPRVPGPADVWVNRQNQGTGDTCTNHDR